MQIIMKVLDPERLGSIEYSTGMSCYPISPSKTTQSAVQMKSESKTAGDTGSVSVKKPSPENYKPINSPNAHKTAAQRSTEKPSAQQVPAITAATIASATSSSFTQPHSPSSSVVNPLQSYPQPSPFLPQSSEWMEIILLKPTPLFGMAKPPCVEGPKRDARNHDFFNPLNRRSQDRFASNFPASTSGRQNHSAMTDEFPHLDIINDILDDEYEVSKATMANTSFHQSFSNPHHLNRLFSLPMDVGMSNDIMGPTTSSSSFEQTRSYRDEGFQHGYGSFGGHLGNSFSTVNPRTFVNGQTDGLIQPNQWQVGGSDLSFPSANNVDRYGLNGYLYHVPNYSSMLHGDNGYTVFRPSKGH